MELIEGRITKIVAEAGMMLTQRADVVRQRIVAPVVYLGVNDSIDRWMEITASEAEILMAEPEIDTSRVLE